MVRFVPGWYAAASRPPASPNRPPGAIEYAEIDAATSVAVFDNGIEVRAPGLGEVGFVRVYLEDIRDVVAHTRGVDVITADDSTLAIGVPTGYGSLGLKAVIDRARQRAASHR
jgi:hypothetical protein